MTATTTSTTANGRPTDRREGRRAVDVEGIEAVLSGETPGCRLDPREPAPAVTLAPGVRLDGETVEYLIGLHEEALSALGDGSDRLASEKVGEALGALKMIGLAVHEREAGR